MTAVSRTTTQKASLVGVGFGKEVGEYRGN